MATYVYACTSKRCRSFRENVRTTMSPTATRLATGSPVTCVCGRVMRLARVEDGGMVAGPEALASYETRRADALERLNSLGVASMPLDVAAATLPDNPEWDAYSKKAVRR